ncbi:Uma2 family endonuclease [Nocardioides sp. Iso805N]|uniref:Uma2 family endonuclease n=1 Tax=Nocardioides sp. Iso805N TaxID=1283287 RepID=UPI0012F7CB18|nr:Uma2 family endonuclease [Nocardioides sp. Iso805N]
MPAAVEEPVRRVPMSLASFLALDPPEGVRAEWVDGLAVMSPTGTRPHQLVAKRLVRLIEDALDGVEAYQEGGISLARSRRIADVFVEVVGADSGDEVWNTVMPLLVAEVISPSSRTEDRVRKLDEYLAGGIGYYLLVDRFENTLVALRNDGGVWTPVLELDTQTPAGRLVVGEHGTVDLDLTALFAF